MATGHVSCSFVYVVSIIYTLDIKTGFPERKLVMKIDQEGSFFRNKDNIVHVKRQRGQTIKGKRSNVYGRLYGWNILTPWWVLPVDR